MTAGELPKVAIFGLLCLAIISAVRAADKHTALASPPFDIHVQPGGFGRAGATDINAVLRSAAGELWRHCPHTQLAGIDVYHRADHLEFIIDEPGSAAFRSFQMAVVESSLGSCTPRKNMSSGGPAAVALLSAFPANSFLSSHGYTRLLAYPLCKLNLRNR